ncbi:acyltransferase [Citricoccus sp. SGAir0253]|uniref:acyltransferase family protein n=1 Tax=Citricoccus sp. SGAir0253 TaxID=2567881 RepID=UPI00143DBCEF|nr:acyltransferase [Citricoccus sp. SGAir0253]
MSRDNAFDFLRLLASLMVLIHHSVIHLDAQFLWHSATAGPWFHGGVSLFFVLSGYLVVRSAERCLEDHRPWWEFYRNRALRILPAIYAYGIVSIVLLLILGVIDLGWFASLESWAFVLSYMFLIPVFNPEALGSFGIGVINGSLWTIPVEVSFYVVVPLVVIAARRWGWRVAMVAVTVLSVAGVVIYGITDGPAAESLLLKVFGVTFIPFLWFFAIGIVWSRAWHKVVKSAWLALASLMAYFAIINVPHGGGEGMDSVLTAVAAVPLSYAALWFGHNAPRFFVRLPRKVGDLSFGTYIWHMFVVNVMVQAGARDWPINGTVLVCLVLAVSMVLAAMSWWLVEKPALRLKHYSIAGASLSFGAARRPADEIVKDQGRSARRF